MDQQTQKFKICISGAAETSHFGSDAFTKAQELGKEIVSQGAILIEGATTGFPYWVAKATKEAGGMVIGVSPASTEYEHVNSYQLPTDHHDLILYTGAGYSGRNLLLTRMADAVIVGPGRMGTINEFTIVFEDKKPLGILEGSWDTDELLKEIIEKSHREEEMKDKIVYSPEPKELVAKVIEMIKQEKDKIKILAPLSLKVDDKKNV